MGAKQHYVPQFYLRNFSDKIKKSIGLFRFQNRKFIRNASIKKIAYRIHYYDEDNTVEGFLAKEEKKWKEILDIFLGVNVTEETIKTIESNGENLYEDLILFLSITAARTARRGDSLIHFMHELDKQFGPDMNSTNYDEFFGEILDSLKHPGSLFINVAIEASQLYCGLRLIVIANNSSQGFITSDVPIIALNPLYNRAGLHEIFSTATVGIVLMIPISCQVCLCFYDPNAYECNLDGAIFELKSKRIITKINRLAVDNSYEEIFFHCYEKEKYIRRICSNRESDHKGRVKFIGEQNSEIAWLFEKQIQTSFLPSCLSIKRETLLLFKNKTHEKQIRPEIKGLYDTLNQ